MTTPTLREAARAICRVQYNGGDPDQPAVRWNGTEMEPQEFPAWEDFLDEARAVIAALAQRDELLAALRDVQRIHEQPTHNGCVDGVSPGTLAHNVARAAIAKAEGRS